MPPPRDDPERSDIAQFAVMQAEILNLKESVTKLKELYDLKTDIAILRVKVAMFATVFGMVAGLCGSIITLVLSKWLGS